MRPRALLHCLFAIALLTGCAGKKDPYDDLSSVAEADRFRLQQCLATPDLPGNQWPADAAKARCWLALPQSPSLKEIAATLAQPGGAQRLDQQYAGIVTEHYADRAHRDRLFRAYRDFGMPEGQQVAAAWLAASPDSPYAQFAQSEAELTEFWRARGSPFYDKTPRLQVASMVTRLRHAMPLLQKALKGEPRLSPACVQLMVVGAAIDDAAMLASATRQCMAIDPLSWGVNNELLEPGNPNWGGSFDTLDGIVAQVRERAKDSPMLASLLGRGIGRRAYMSLKDQEDLASIAPALDKAALTAPDVFYLDKAGKAAEQAGHGEKALLYYNQALRFAPDEPGFVINRAHLLAARHDRYRALQDALHAQRLPDLCKCDTDYAALAQVFEILGRIDDERAELGRAMNEPDMREYAQIKLCDTYISREFDAEHALACTSRLVEEYPVNENAAYMRALVLYVAHQPGGAEAEAHWRTLVDPDDPERDGLIEQLARAKASKADGEAGSGQH